MASPITLRESTRKEWKEFHYMSMIEMKDVVKKYD
ncbi:hypothetical protein Q604_UNBc4C00091G0001, partial [human gut metagenome]